MRSRILPFCYVFPALVCLLLSFWIKDRLVFSLLTAASLILILLAMKYLSDAGFTDSEEL